MPKPENNRPVPPAATTPATVPTTDKVVNRAAEQFSVVRFALPTTRQKAFAATDGSTSIKLATVYLSINPSGLTFTANVRRRDLVEERDGKRFAVSEYYLSMPTRATAGGAIQTAILSVPEGDQHLTDDYAAWRESVVTAFRKWAKEHATGSHASSTPASSGRVVESREIIAEPAS